MNQERLIKILQSPRVTEKSTRIQADGYYVFRVEKTATKKEIADAVKQMFNVEVEKVRVCNVRGKKKTFGRFLGQRQDWKKAYILLKEGHTINFGNA